jgi:hypothetical protein
MLLSPAYRSLTWNGHKALIFLETEHMIKKGEQNGHLVMPYRQLAQAGINKDAISATIQHLIACKLVERTREGTYRANAKGAPATYRLTYQPTRKGTGGNEYERPKHDWRDYKSHDTATTETSERDKLPRRAANEA